MNRILALIGIALTVAYLGLLVYISAARASDLATMPLNNLGDFLAGALGPLAILWLILGFFQQGIELRQNTEALRLQAHELKQSVEQQRQLVESSRKSSAAQNILAVVTFLQAEDVRAARTIVRQDLRSIPMGEWSSLQRQAASRVCATYDVAAVLLREGLVPLRPFADNWGPSIKDCYLVLLPFIESMQSPENSGPRYWNDFGWLYEQVVRAHGDEV